MKDFLVLLRNLDLSPEACEQSMPGRGGRGTLDTNILSPQFSGGLAQITRHVADGVGESPAWRLGCQHGAFEASAVDIMGKCCRCQNQQLCLGTWGLHA